MNRLMFAWRLLWAVPLIAALTVFLLVLLIGFGPRAMLDALEHLP